MKRISMIEGLRGYLAMWVVFDHVIASSGYDVTQLNKFWELIRSGWYAVDIFIIISGFVIFYLLDHKHEPYKAFITRRFFRLWPLFIFLFLISIPVSLVALSNANQFEVIFPNAIIGDGAIGSRVGSWWDNIWVHILLHTTMMHGVVPQSFLPYSPSAFLGPAWSISLEMQFYLIAPAIFWCLSSSKRLGAVIITAVVAVTLLLRDRLPVVQSGAFLPMHVEYFYLGGLSYFIYKRAAITPPSFNCRIIGTVVSLFIFIASKGELNLIPVCFWILFMGLVVDGLKNNPAPDLGVISWIFDNDVAQYLGKVSYSIYLVHGIIIALCQALILEFVPGWAQLQHCLSLGLLTLIFTVISAHYLYRFIERPGNELGAKVASFFATSSTR